MREARKRKHRVLRHLLFQEIREKEVAGRQKMFPGKAESIII